MLLLYCDNDTFYCCVGDKNYTSKFYILYIFVNLRIFFSVEFERDKSVSPLFNEYIYVSDFKDTADTNEYLTCRLSSNSFAQLPPVHAAETILKQSGVVRPPPSPPDPFKICKYTSEVRIYSSVSNDGERRNPAVQPQFSAVSHFSASAVARWKNGFSFVAGEEGKEGCIPREGLA